MTGFCNWINLFYWHCRTATWNLMNKETCPTALLTETRKLIRCEIIICNLIEFDCYVNNRLLTVTIVKDYFSKILTLLIILFLHFYPHRTQRF